MPLDTQPAERIAFGSFELEIASSELFKKGRRVRLSGQPAHVLAILVSRRGTLVSREELRLALWPEDTFVDFDHGLNNCIRRIRDVLGDSTESPRYIETLPKKGYRFIAETHAVLAQQSVAAPPDAARAVAAAERVAAEEPTSDSLAAPGGGWRGRDRPAALVLLAVLLVVGVGSLFLPWSQILRHRPASADVGSLALLPLTNSSGDSSQDDFVDGVTDELITELGQTASVPVISRNSAMVYKNNRKTVSEIARELRVDQVVEGSLSRTGVRLHMTVHLIDGGSDRALWTQAYDGSMGDVHELEMRVAADVAAHLHSPTPLRAQDRTQKPVSTAAYEEYQKGQHLWNMWELWAALPHFQRAAAIEPGYADAYGGIAKTYCLMEYWQLLPSDVALTEASNAAEKALSFDQHNGDAHAARSYVLAVRDWNWPEAEAEIQRAIDIDPSSSYAHLWYAFYLYSRKGREADGLRQTQLAVRLDPASSTSLGVYGVRLVLAGNFKEAIEQYQAAIELATGAGNDWRFDLAEALARSGQVDRAATELEKAYIEGGATDIAAEFKRRYATAGYAKAAAEANRAELLVELRDLESKRAKGEFASTGEYLRLHAGLKNREETLHWLDEAYREHTCAIIQLGNSIFDFIRDDPHFQRIYQSVGFFR